MALPIKPIPTLTGKLAEDFVRKADENAKKRGTKIDEEQQKIMRSIISKSKLNMKKITVSVTQEYEIEVNPDHHIVREYNSMQELVKDCISYRFSEALPVIGERGVIIKDDSISDWSYE